MSADHPNEMSERVSYYKKIAASNPKFRAALTPKLNKYIPHEPSEKQAAFLLLDNKEAFYGGAAGGGKSEALLMASLQYIEVPDYSALLLRRTFRELSMPKAILDRSTQWLKNTDMRWRPKQYTWESPQGGRLTFGYLDHESDVYQYDSAEFQFIGFDELTQFTEFQYTFMFGRLRRTRGMPVPLRMRGASNPGGVGHIWCKNRFVKSLTAGRIFIPAKMQDNKHLDSEEYSSALDELDPVTQAQRRDGDWDAEYIGAMFKRSWFTKYVRTRPQESVSVRFWDLASLDGRGDYTVGTKVSKTDNGVYYIEDVIRKQMGPMEVEQTLLATARLDGDDVTICIEQEPGSAGKHVLHNYIRMLAGYTVKGSPATGSKLSRYKPFAAQAEVGNVILLDGPWNSEWIDEICAVPESKHDDQADSASGAVNELSAEVAGDWGISVLGSL